MEWTDSHALKELSARLREAPRLLLLLDYDGTLVPFFKRPEEAAPDEALLALLRALAALRGREVHVVSGRLRADIERWLGALPVGLHAEHGLWSRPAPGAPWQTLPGVPTHWKEEIRPLLTRFCQETPGALIEEKSASLAWHYRGAEEGRGDEQARTLRGELERLLVSSPAEILWGDKVIEIRVRGVHKGRIVASLCAERPDVKVLALGDDRTDEDLFAALPDSGVAVHVGPRPSRAPYRLQDPEAARAFLRTLL